MQRYFIAIIPPAEISDRITEIKKYFFYQFGCNCALNSPPHITLRPPFKMFKQMEAIMDKSLCNFASSCIPFDIELNGFAHFRQDVIFVNPLDSDRLHKMYLSLQEWLQSKNSFPPLPGYPEFHPHITVAYRDLGKKEFELAWQEFKDKNFKAEFSVKSIFLLKHLQKKWEVIKEFSFPVTPIKP